MNAKGDIECLGVAWWDKQAQGQRFVWCENSNPDGCYVSREVAKWNGERLEWKEEQDKRVYSEIFKDITPDSFTQVKSLKLCHRRDAFYNVDGRSLLFCGESFVGNTRDTAPSSTS
jgi:hypothetical protein